MQATFVALALSLPLAGVRSAEPELSLEAHQDGSDDRARLADLVGSWSGILGYRDYRSDEWVELQTTEASELAADGEWLVTRASFDEGSWTMHTLELTTIVDGPAPFVTLSSGRGEMLRAERRIHRRELRGAGSWKIVFLNPGQDDGRDAQIRETIELDGDHLTRTKEVDFADDGEASWIVRNRVSLSRERPTIERLVGDWQLVGTDFAELELELCEGELRGRVDGEPIERVDVLSSDGALSFAFRVPGSDEDRIVQGRWSDGRLAGSLYSPTAGHLLAWSARRR